MLGVNNRLKVISPLTHAQECVFLPKEGGDVGGYTCLLVGSSNKKKIEISLMRAMVASLNLQAQSVKSAKEAAPRSVAPHGGELRSKGWEYNDTLPKLSPQSHLNCQRVCWGFVAFHFGSILNYSSTHLFGVDCCLLVNHGIACHFCCCEH
jgi:hypothetical protein